MIGDQLLLQGILSHDRRAVIRFYNHYSPKLLKFIRQRVRDECDVEEIAQDTLYAFLEGARDFSGKSSLYTYLCAIASHKIVDFYRKKRLKKIVFSQLPQGIEVLISELVSDPQKIMESGLIRSKITQIFRKLAPIHARILHLKYIEGRSVEEISRLLNISFKSVESGLFRARRAFVKLYIT